jgi:hypothetical protein
MKNHLPNNPNQRAVNQIRMKSLLLFLILLLIIPFTTSLAEDLISNVQATPKVDASNKKYIEVNYDLSKSAYVEIFRIEVTDESGKSTYYKPPETEAASVLQGDIRYVKTDAPAKKTFKWYYSTAIKELSDEGLSGEIKCKIVIQTRGTKPSMVSMKIGSYNNGSFRLPTNTVDMFNYEDGTEIYSGVSGMGYYGTWYKEAEKDNATFFPAKQVVNFPYYIHSSPNFAGYPNLASGSSYFAYADISATERRIWIIMAMGKNQGVGGAKYSDFQIHYYQRTDGEQYGKIGQCYAGADWEELAIIPSLRVTIMYQDIKPVKSNEVSLGKAASLNIVLNPNKTDYKLKLGDSTDIEINITDMDNAPVAGATVNITDELATPVTSTLTTKADGKCVYTVRVPKDTISQTYFVKFSATKDAIKSDEITCSIKVGDATVLVLEVQPGTRFEMKPKDIKDFTIIVTDGKNPIENATVKVINCLVDSTDEVVVGTTNSFGKITYRIEIPDKAEEKDYSVKFFAIKDKYETSDTSNCTITVSTLKKTWTCYKGGTAFYEFRIEDISGEWKGDNGNILSYDGQVSVNDFLKFNGHIELDTTTGAASIKSNGHWFLKDVPDIFSGNIVDKYIWSGNFNAVISTNDTTTVPTLISLGLTAAAAYGSAMKLAGFAILPQNIKFTGGLKSPGIKMDIDILIPGIAKHCGDEIMEELGNITGIRLYGVGYSKSGFTFDGVTVANIGLFGFPTGVSLSGKAMEGVCIKEITLKKDDEKKSFDFQFSLKAPPVFDEASAGFSLLNGQLEGFNIKIKLDPGVGAPIPLPPPPAGPIFTWLGFAVAVKGIQAPPLDFTGTSYFSHVNIPKLATFAQLFEIEGTVHIQWPEVWELIGTTRYFKLADIWIALGQETYQLKVGPEYSWSISKEGTIKVGNFGGESWCLEGSTKGSLYHDPATMIGVSTTVKGSAYVPDLFSGNTYFKELNIALKLPWKLWGIEAILKDFAFTFNADLSTYRLGIWGVKLNLPKYGTTGFITIGAGTAVSLNKKLRIDDVPISAIYDIKNDEESIPLIPNIKTYKPSILVPDTSYVSIPIASDVAQLFVRVNGQNTMTNSFIMTPAGVKYDKTKPDSTIIKFVGDGTNASSCLWVVESPVPGEWKLGVIDKKPTDSIFVFSLTKQREPFKFTSTSQDRKITMNWNATGAPAESTVDFFIDDDSTGYDGKLIGTAFEKDGTFSYTMNDSIPSCLYYVYGVRLDRDIASQSYSKTGHSNPKLALSPPNNIQAISDNTGFTHVQWDYKVDSSIFGYSVSVIDENGKDSVYAITAKYLNYVDIQILNQNTKKIIVRTIGQEGQKGCWSSPVSIITGIEEEPVAGLDLKENSIGLIPNPTDGTTNVRINLTEPTFIRLSVFDILGTKVAILAEGLYGAGQFKTIWDGSNFPTGTYFVRLETNENVKSEMLILMK